MKKESEKITTLASLAKDIKKAQTKISELGAVYRGKCRLGPQKFFETKEIDEWGIVRKTLFVL